MKLFYTITLINFFTPSSTQYSMGDVKRGVRYQRSKQKESNEPPAVSEAMKATHSNHRLDFPATISFLDSNNLKTCLFFL